MLYGGGGLSKNQHFVLYSMWTTPSKMAVSGHLGFCRTAYSAIRSADPENCNLEPNMEWIGCTVCEIFAFKLYCDLETGVPVDEI